MALSLQGLSKAVNNTTFWRSLVINFVKSRNLTNLAHILVNLLIVFIFSLLGTFDSIHLFHPFHPQNYPVIDDRL